ncbi:MAG TPA: hypothetical protein VFF27_06565, partial [Bacteroidia bacterium]|jgi:hypothetical protein|nr:hypothetical protein [Bacteroidia bacterium]
LLVESDLDATFDGMRNVLIRTNSVSMDPHIGLEASYNNIIFLRGGLGNYQSYTDASRRKITTVQPNIGVGIHIKSFYLDYALTDIGDQSVALYSHVFSVKLEINKKVK